MEIIQQVQLDKSRGYAACVSEANKMFLGNVRMIFRRVWIYALVYALLVALCESYAASVEVGDDDLSGVALVFVLSFVVPFCAFVGYGARVTTLLNGWTMRRNIIRWALLTSCSFLIGLLIIVGLSVILYRCFIAETSFATLFFSSAGYVVVIALLCLPLIYSYMRYMLDAEARFGGVFLGYYKTGARHWGFIFMASLLAFMMIGAATLVISMPLAIVMIANAWSTWGVSTLADPAGLPDNFWLIRFLVMLLTTFVVLLINVITMFVYYFIYGSIEAREREKNEFLKRQS